MAGCCVVILAPILLILGVIILSLLIGTILTGLTFTTIGLVTKFLLKDTKYSFISNIFLTIGIVILLFLISLEFPIVGFILCNGISIYLLVKYKELVLLEFYVPATLVFVLVGLLLIPEHLIFATMILVTFIIIAIIFFIYFLSQGRIIKEKPILIKELYSTIFFIEAIISIIIYFIKLNAGLI